MGIFHIIRKKICHLVRIEAIIIVDKDRCAYWGTYVRLRLGAASQWNRDDVEVVVVVAGDGEVPHPPVMLDGDGSADDGGSGAVRGLEVLTFRYFVRRNPVVEIRVLTVRL